MMSWLLAAVGSDAAATSSMICSGQSEATALGSSGGSGADNGVPGAGAAAGAGAGAPTATVACSSSGWLVSNVRREKMPSTPTALIMPSMEWRI